MTMATTTPIATALETVTIATVWATTTTTTTRVMTTTKTMATTKVATMMTEATRRIRAPAIWIAIAMKAAPTMATMITTRW